MTEHRSFGREDSILPIGSVAVVTHVVASVAPPASSVGGKRLTDLEPQFVRIHEELREHDRATMPTGNEAELRAWIEAGRPSAKVTEPTEIHTYVQTLAEADGIFFTCPLCGGHQVAPTFAGRGIPDHLGSQNRDKKPSRWTVSGNGYHDLTLYPSIDLSNGNPASCQWHGFVTNGVAR